MFRFTLALLALSVVVTTADAQPNRPPLSKQLPLSPGVFQGSSIGPGTQFLPQPAPRFRSTTVGASGGAIQPFAGGAFFPAVGFGPGFGYGGWAPGFGYGPPVVIERVPVPAAVPQPPERTVVLANEFPATLIVQLPAAADIWLNGKEVVGSAAEERALTSPVLKPGESFAFVVKARWTLGGKTYEANRTVTLGAGDRSRLIVVSGTEVK